jgi:large subunit ribosomal protein L18
MSSRKPKTVLFRRKREKKTNYAKRLSLLLSRKNRLVVRFTNQRIIAQLVSFTTTGDKVLLGLDSFALKKEGWKHSCKNIPAAYLMGLYFGKVALKNNLEEAIIDTGFKTPQQKGKLYAFLKGAIDSGMKIPHGDESIFPDDARLSGEHIKNHATLLKDKGGSQLAQYLKNNSKLEAITEDITAMRKKLENKND